jgi:hypothetical protein
MQIPKVQKKTIKLSVFFALSGSVSTKAAYGTLVKLTPGDNPIKEILILKSLN